MEIRKQAENYLFQAISEVGEMLPENIITIDDIQAELKKHLDSIELSSLYPSFSDLFQLNRIRDGKEFAKGFPGIVLTACIGKMIDPSYSPSTEFYSINPRPLFEKHIGPILRDKFKAPMGKSDPLNVAKNINVIDQNWARGKRPEYAAFSAVNLIKSIDNANLDQLQVFLNALVWIYLALSKLYSRELPRINSGISAFDLHNIVVNLIENAPAGGETAQEIVGALLFAQHEIFGQKGALEGIGESINATNTTSGKPGDFSEIFGNHLRIYEVTTKKVDIQRINESSDAVRKFISTTNSIFESIEVTFLCKLQEVDLGKDYQTTSSNAEHIHDGIFYNFIELERWIFFQLERLGASGRAQAINKIQSYIEDSKTKLEVKRVWEERMHYSTL